MKLKTRRVEEIVIPPLPEYSYVCNGEIVSTTCKGTMIFRDPDFITLQPQDALTSFSINSLLSLKTRGRKYKRWSHYVSRYSISLDGKDFEFLLSLNGLLTIYVDGLDVCGVSGDVVYKEYRVVTTKKDFDEKLGKVIELKPHLVIVEERDLWIAINGYKVLYIEDELRKELSKLVGVSRLECKEVVEVGTTLVCKK